MAAVSFWAEDRLAAKGIQNVAELGSKTALLGEVTAALAAGTAGSAISGPGITAAQTEASVDFTLTPAHPLLTLVSMVAPSPDWFVGVTGMALYANGKWPDTLSVPLEVYDTGTDSGVTFTSLDQAAVPPVLLQTLTSAPADTDFAAGVHRSSGAHIARMVFLRLA